MQGRVDKEIPEEMLRREICAWLCMCVCVWVGVVEMCRSSIHLCACVCGECARRPDTSDVQGWVECRVVGRAGLMGDYMNRI